MEIPIDPRNAPRWEIILNAPPQVDGEVFPPDLVDAVTFLWKDPGVQQAFGRRNELQLNDSAP